MSTSLEQEVKQLIIDSLNLEDLTVDDIETDIHLFGGGLGLGSIDALELGLALKKKYNITISPESEDMKKVFTSVRTIVDFIENSATKI